jgi:outer membrane protein TolC
MPRPWPLLALNLLFASAAFAAGAPEALTLQEALDRFRAEAPTLAQLDARVAEAKAAVRLAAAPALPMLAVQGTYTRNNAEVSVELGTLIDTLTSFLPPSVEIDTDGMPGNILIQPLEQLNAAAVLRVPVLAPQAWAELHATRRVAEASERSAEAARQQAETALVRGAWLASAAEAMVQAADRAVLAAQAHEQAAVRRQQAGLGTELDVLTARTATVQRQSDALQAHADLDRAQRALGALLGRGGAVRVQMPEPEPTAFEPDEAARTARADNPAARASQATLTASGAAVRATWWRHAPTLAATGQLFASDVAYPTGLKTGWRVGLQLDWVLYDGGARYGMLHRARAQEQLARAQASQATLDLDRQARDAVSDLETATQRRRLAEQATQTAAAAADSAERLYAAGLATSLQVQDALQRRLEAEVALAVAGAQLGVAGANLDLALGRPAP